MDDKELARVARQLSLPGVGLKGQQKLADAHVLVIGAGGLGCPILQSLAAAGVGHISVIDDDTVDLTNIHRQTLFSADDVGRPKVDVAAERMRGLQPGITVNGIKERLDEAHAVELVGGVDLVVDGSDGFATKYLTADAAEITGTPLVWGTVLRFDGQVAFWHSGPGASSDRGVGLRDLFPTQPGADSAPDCATAGVLGVTTTVVGALMATEAVKFLIGIGEVIPGKLFTYDALSTSLRSVTVSADPDRTLVHALQPSYLDAGCAVPGGEQEAVKLLDQVLSGTAVAMDIREAYERLLKDLPEQYHPHRLPLSEIDSENTVRAELENLAQQTREVVVFCASGKRSADFVENYQHLAHEAGVSLTSLPGGVPDRI